MVMMTRGREQIGDLRFPLKAPREAAAPPIAIYPCERPVVAVVRAVIGAKHRSARTGSKAQAPAVENRSVPEINCCCLRHRF
jgi:hypothetical protein